MDFLDQDTPYVKTSQKPTPPKADHKHEYVRVVMWNRIRRFDGTITEQKYKFYIPDTCIECGHSPRGRRKKHAVEVEVTPREFHRIEATRKK